MLEAMRDQAATWFITGPVGQEDQLLDAKEGVLDRIRTFMSGPQKAIYDDVRAFLNAQDQNIAYVDNGAEDALRMALADPDCFRGNAMQSLKVDFYALKERVEQAVLAERNAVIAAIDEVAAKITQTSEFIALPADQQACIQAKLADRKSALGAQNLIPALRNQANEVRANLLADTLTQIATLAPPPEPYRQREPAGGELAEAPAKDPVKAPPAPAKPKYINARSITVPFAKPYLEDEADVTRYLDEMRKTLLAEIAAGKKVTV
ncbi:hypothetical protein SAMN04244548_03657 [Paracoccus pantotrophus]|nr:hypothetical protein SAMN04244548_03657 [Paracoccus pantotrophus]